MICMVKTLIQRGGFGLVALLVLTGSLSAHPFHTTTAEMEFNSVTRRFEVALKIPASDFEHMVRMGLNDDEKSQASTQAASKLAIEEMAKSAGRYIDKQFFVTVAGQACRFEWVGVEDDQQSKWMYFELILPSEQSFSGELQLTNKVLCDRNSDQFNTVVFISNAGRVSLKTHQRAAVVSLPRLP